MLNKRDELRDGYQRADFPKGFTRGKYAMRFAQGTNIVRLDPEIHAVFPTSKAVNNALGELLGIAKSARVVKRPSSRSGGSRR
jgi:hypothetical protein